MLDFKHSSYILKNVTWGLNMHQSLRSRLSGLMASDDDTALPASDRIYRVLRLAVRDLSLRPGEQLIDIDIAELFSVSKTPAREAFARLQSDGLIEIRPKQGTYVRSIVLDEIIEAMRIREALEVVVTREAARRQTPNQKVRMEANLNAQSEAVTKDEPLLFNDLDNQFHDLLAEASGYQRIPNLLHATRLQIGRVRRLSAPIPGRTSRLLEQHRAIAQGVIAGNAVMAAEAMLAHMEEVFPMIEHIYATHPDAFGASA